MISILIGSLTKYYAEPRIRVKKEERAHQDQQNANHLNKNTENPLSHVFFASIYIALLIIVGIFYGLNYDDPQYNELFESWQQFSAANVIKLSCAIALSFFFPGYAVITIISDRKNQGLRILPKILLGYILSIGIVGFLGYITAMMGFAVSDIKLALILAHVIILVLYIKQLDIIPTTRLLFHSWKIKKFSLAEARYKFTQSLPEIIVFSSLLGLVILSTYVLYDGVMVGDQWFHHGRALQFISGDYKAITTSNTDFLYPPLLSAFLSSFFVLADVPTVNAYASIGFLNIISVFAFYYFLQNWIPIRRKKSALLAATLFVLSSGFGWIYAISIFIDDPGPPSQNSALLSILAASKQTYDIRSPSTFLLASHPDISTGLQLIVLPIGFVLLGLIKDEKIKPKYQSYITLIISAILLVGIFSHDEIYFFIIIACMLPIVFGLRDKGFVYLGILSANGIAIFANYIFLDEYLSETVIMGIPLIVISFFFIMITWAIYSSRFLEKLNHAIGTRKTAIKNAFSHKNSLPYSSHVKFTLSVILVSVVCYLYLFSYITWAELSVKDVEAQTSELFPRNVPYYLLPMKLGLIGILGLSFVLSYIFRRFEKEVFVFGIIIIVAIITGPYYDEHRFNKYVMVGLVGFASLFIYDVIVIINNRFRYGPLLSGMFVGIIIVLSCLSTLMFVGFQASAIETNNLDFLWEGRRNFPSPSELQVLQFLRNYTDSYFDPPGVYNIVTWPNEYQLKLGLIGKFEGFLGLPIPKMLQSPLALNASALESFYNLLAKSDARFIVVPSPGIANKGDVLSADGKGSEQAVDADNEKIKEVPEKIQETGPLREPTDIQNFALVNFDKIYHDGKFVVLSVPDHLTPPSSSGENAIILSGTEGVSADPKNPSVMVTLPYTNKFYNKLDDSDFAKVSKDNEKLFFDTYNKSQTLWSRDVEYQNGNLDYIETNFMTINQNKDKENIECGIVWEAEGEKKYYVRIKDDKLEFSETPASKDRFIFENQQVKLNELIPYTLKLVFSESTLDVYVDNMLGFQVPNEFYHGANANTISRIGVRCSGNIAEFEPIKIAQIDQLGGGGLDYPRNMQQNYEYYYPLTTLALSGIGYDTFLPNDYSIFSKDNIVLTTRSFDDYYGDNGKVNKSTNIDKFLDYVKKGGKLTVISTESPIDGWFAEAFSIKSISNNNTEFNSVVESTGPRYSVDLLGTTPRIGSTSSDVIVKSYYQMNSQKVSPFALEKTYGKGKIILVNAAGFFDAISRGPEKYFSRLADIPVLVGIAPNSNKSDTKLISIPPNYNLGNLRITGTSTINSSSLLLGSENENIPNRYFVEDVSILTNNTEDGDVIAFSTKAHDVNYGDSITQHKEELGGSKTSIFKNLLIKDLELQGLYNVTIKSFGTLQLPSPSSPFSKSNYVSLSLPEGFDIQLTLSNDSSAQITLANGTKKTIGLGGGRNNSNNTTDDTSDGARIYFQSIQLDQPHGNPVSVLMKRPEILAYGNATFDSLFQGGVFDLKGIEGNFLETGNDSSIDLKLDYVDSYHSSSKRKQTTDYITYIDSLNIDRISENAMDQQIELRIPGDISDASKQAGMEVPWEKGFSSHSNIAALTIFIVAAGLIILILWPRLKNQAKAPR